MIRTTKKGDDWFHFGRACLRAVITLAAFGYPRRNAQGERGLVESDAFVLVRGRCFRPCRASGKEGRLVRLGGAPWV